MSQPELIFNIITMGESSVGKTCIINKFVNGECTANQLATIGVDFKTKRVTIAERNVKLKICDTAGQERFRNLTSQYYKNAQGILLVYDVTCRASFEHVDYWMTQIRNNAGAKDVCVAMIGNKIDKEKERCVMKEEGEEKAKEFQAMFYETSAFEGIGIGELFEELIKEMVRREESKERKEDNDKEKGGERSVVMKSKANEKRNKTGCC